MQECVLITGAGGFLGFNLLKTLVEKKYAKRYIVIDNFITSNPRQLHKYINRTCEETVIDLVCADICDSNLVEKITSKYEHVSEIYHLASLASPPFYKNYPLQTLDVGYIGMKNMLELCKFYTEASRSSGSSCRLLYTSTSEVYGDALQHPQKESYYGNVNSFGERSCYDESKRIGETLIFTYTKLYNIDARIVRIFNTYGPHMRLGDGRIVTEIIRCLLLGKPLQIFGDGTQTRSLSFVDDTIEMTLRVMKSDYLSPVNVGNDKEVSVNELVQIAKRVYEQRWNNNQTCDLVVEYTPIDKDDPKVRRPDLTLNRNIVGHFIPTSLELGLSKTMSYFRELIDLSENL